MEMKLKNGQSDRMRLTKPFKGFVIGLYVEEDTGANIGSVHKMDLRKIQLTLENKKTRVECWSFSLAQAMVAFGWSDRDLLNTLQQQYDLSLAATSSISSCNIPMDTYDGDYELHIEMNDAMPNGTHAKSYLTCTPEWSMDYMDYEVHYEDYSLDRGNFNEDFGHGIEEIILFDISEAGYNSTDAFLSNFKRSTVTASEFTTVYNNVPLRVHTALQLDQPSPSMNILVLHDDEVLNNVSVSIESDTPNDNYHVMYRRLWKNPAAAASEAISNEKRQRAEDKIPEITTK